jgi:hypothetical protein
MQPATKSTIDPHPIVSTKSNPRKFLLPLFPSEIAKSAALLGIRIPCRHSSSDWIPESRKTEIRKNPKRAPYVSIGRFDGDFRPI